jgi:uncharacterized protein YdbL (DUF1318 family)
MGLILVLVALAFLLASSSAVWAAEKTTTEKATTEKATTQKPVTEKITGKVIAAKKDPKTGNLLKVAIKTEKAEYAVVNKGKGKDLLKLLDKKVDVTGTVTEVKGKKLITVAEFREALP